MIDFYQGPLNHCSAVRYGECPMYPSCSEYCKQAFEKYGFFVGAMIASDRLMRCGRDELKSAPLIFVNGKWKYYDPLERNTSWWQKIGSLDDENRQIRSSHKKPASSTAPEPIRSREPIIVSITHDPPLSLSIL